MSTIVTRAGKGSPLTWNEVDNNFTNLNTDKYQSGSNVSLGTIAGTTITSSALTSGRVTFASTGGLLADSANLTFDGTTLSTVGLTTTGNTILGNASTDTLNVGNGGLVKDASGNVGIGTASPSTYGKFAVVGSDASALYSQVVNTNASGLALLQVQGTGAKQSYFWQASASYSTYHSLVANNAGIYATTNLSYEADGAFYQSWWTNNAERMRLDSSGNLGLGTASPSTYTTGFGTGLAIASPSNGGYLPAISLAKTGAASGGAQTWTMYVDNTRQFTLYNFTSSADAFAVNTNGAVSLQGAVKTATGVGITFPAAQSASSNASTLDDYEEGTWTPSLNGSVSLGSSATYIKIGRLVYCKIAAYNVDISSIGLSTNLSLTGFPFPIAAYGYCLPCAQQANVTYGLFDGNGTNWNMGVGGSALDYQAVTRTTFGSTAAMSFRFSFTYEATD